MPNMSYCRFQNTARDLAECESILEDLFVGAPGVDLSDDEARSAVKLIQTAFNIVELLSDSANSDLPLDEMDSEAVKVLAKRILNVR